MTAPGQTGPSPRLVGTFRAAAVCVVLTAFAFLQQPGRVVPDTKVDLTVDPVRFLGRALHMWDPLGAFGQVQNQAYGYLWPMGPFFAAGHAVGAPAWAVQRAWWAVLLCLAFLGIVRLAGSLGVGTPSARLVAGVAFAVAPRLMTVLGPISAEALPMALAPWVLLPLVGAARGAPLRRSALRSAAVVGCVGGVNAAATLAVLVLPVLWLLGLDRGPARRRLAAWWVAGVGLATAWWVVPLLLLGRYSPPFLDYIESARITTRPTSLVEVLRGTSHWVPYLFDANGPVWAAGWQLVTQPVIVAETVALVALGLVGLSRRAAPHRRWLVAGLCVGVAAVAFGHVGPVDGLSAGHQRALLDGVLAPLRNVHKYDVVLRIPLALGLCHAVAVLARAFRRRRARDLAVPGAGRMARWRPVRAAVLLGAALLGAGVPLVSGALPNRGTWWGVPGYWEDAARWLGTHPRDRSLVVPGSTFADYYWGRTGDEILQPLARAPWAVRNGIPLAPAGDIRMLDAVESRLASGEGSSALADDLARAGVRYLVVRNDLDYGAAGAPRPVLVHLALARSPGIARVRTFGPTVGGGNRFAEYVDAALDLPYPAVEVYEVHRPTGPVGTSPLAGVTVVDGAPEDVLTAAETGVLGSGPAVLAGDVTGTALAGARRVVTDGLRRREVSFGRVEDGRSATLSAAAPWTFPGPAHDYVDPGRALFTTAEAVGADQITASSSASEATALGGARPDRSPYAAVDGDHTTAWRSDVARGVDGQWWQVRFGAPRTVPEVRLAFDAGAGRPPRRVLIETDHRRYDVAVRSGTLSVRLGAEPVRRLRVTAVGGPGLGSFALAEVELPGVELGRTLVVPGRGAGSTPPAWSFSAAPGARDGCVQVVSDWLCTAALPRGSEDGGNVDRTVVAGTSAEYTPHLRVRPRPGAALDVLLAEGRRGVTADASSSAVPDPHGGPQSAADLDRGTAWTSASGDRHPWLRLRWTGARPVRGVELSTSGVVGASLPRRVTVDTDEGPRTARVDGSGVAAFDRPAVTRSLTIHFTEVGLSRSIDPYSRQLEIRPVGITEARPLTDRDPRRAENTTAPVVIPCDEGPAVRVDGRLVRTTGRTTRGGLLGLRPFDLRPCAGQPAVRLDEGRRRIVAAGTPALEVDSLALVPVSGAAATTGAPGAAEVGRWGPSERTVRVPASAGPVLLTVHENVNAGWRATLGGRELQRITVDGWQQGYVVPAGAAGVVHLVYTPDRWYRLGLAAGLLAALLVLGGALLPERRGRGAALAPSRGTAVTVLGAACLVLAGGVWAVVLLAAALGLRSAAARRWPGAARRLSLWGPAVSFAVAGGAVAVWPWPTPGYPGGGAVTQLLCLAALALVWAPAPRRRDRAADGAGAAARAGAS